MAEIQRLTPTHDAMMDWVIQNPGATLAQMGSFFGYSVSWLSQVLNSDLFKAKYAERRAEINALVARSIPERMASIATISLEKLEQYAIKSEDRDFHLDLADKVLHRLGYAPSKGPTNISIAQTNAPAQVTLSITKNELASARELMGQLSQQAASPPSFPIPAAPQNETVYLPENTADDSQT